MSQSRPTTCEECGAELRVVNRDTVESMGYAKPVRIDWDFECAANPGHPIVHWIELPE